MWMSLQLMTLAKAPFPSPGHSVGVMCSVPGTLAPAGRFWNELLGERVGECGLGEGVGGDAGVW